MTNIIILVRDRPRLTEQCLRTLYMHTPIRDFNLTIINDGSQSETTRLIEQKYASQRNCETVHVVNAIGVIGFLKNLGVWVSERCFGRGEWLYIGDNDTCFSSGWLEKMIAVADVAVEEDFCLFGGQVHPFHHAEKEGQAAGGHLFTEHKMLDGPSWLMPWGTWDHYGPLDQDGPPGVCKGEDVTFCHRITAAGGRIGVIYPHVVYHTGLKQTDGNLGPGSDLRSEQRVAGVIYE